GTSRDDCMPGGTWHYGGLAPGEMRGLVPTTVTVYRHLSPCRHLPGRAVESCPPHRLCPAAVPGTVCPRAVAPPTRCRQPSCRTRHVVVCCPSRRARAGDPAACWRPLGRASRWCSAAAGEGSRWRGGVDAVGGTGRVP